MPTLFIHIGLPKTGTTSIQNFLAINRNILQSKGFCFPDFKIMFPNIAVNRNAHFLMQEYFDEDKNRLLEKEEKLVQNCLGRIVQLSKKYPNIIISDEKLWRGSKEHDPLFWNKLVKWGEENNIVIKMIAYLRRQDYFIQSNWGELVKQHITSSFTDYLKNDKIKKPELNYYAHLQPIAETLGKENMIIRVYDKKISLFDDFARSIQLELSDDFQYRDGVKNPSFLGIYLEVKRLLNRLPGFKEKRSFVLNLINEIQVHEKESVNFQSISYFSPKEQIAFLSKYEEGNAAIAREYLNREDGILFEEESESLQESEYIKENYSKEELVAVCGKIILLQQQKIMILEKKLKLFHKLQKEFGSHSDLLGRIKRKLFR